MLINNKRLRDIPHSAETIASLDSQHERTKRLGRALALTSPIHPLGVECMLFGTCKGILELLLPRTSVDKTSAVLQELLPYYQKVPEGAP